jgi:hypothetical protein
MSTQLSAQDKPIELTSHKGGIKVSINLEKRLII